MLHVSLEWISLKVTHLLLVAGEVQFHETVLTEEARALWSQFVILCNPLGALITTHRTEPSPNPMLVDENGVLALL